MTCKAKQENNGVCPHHNLQCGWPKCNELEQEPVAWVPYLSDRADGVKGHYAIARWNPRGYREVWNLRRHEWGAYSDDVLSLEEADTLLRLITIPTRKVTSPQPPQRKPLTDEWIPVTQALLNEQHGWLYKPMWIAMPNGHVCTGYYEWRQGRCPDRFITDDLGDMDAFSASHVMPLVKPKAPSIEAAHGIKE